jgi:hypothetical protein
MMAARIPRRQQDRPAEPPARVVVRPELLHTIGAASALAGRNETGGPLLGTIQRSWEGATPTLIVSVLGTVPPGAGLEAAPSRVGLGNAVDGERAASALRWWRSVTGFDLLHLGDWHKHPSGCPEPSRGDRATARGMSLECSAPLWLVAVGVSGVRMHRHAEAEGNIVRRSTERVQADELRFYRADPRAGLARLPVRIDGKALPRLPRLPWHIAQPARFAAECRMLREAGFTPALRASLRHGRPAVELRLAQDGGAALTVVTGPRFPEEAPELYDERGRALRLPGGWSPGRFLVDAVNGTGRR